MIRVGHTGADPADADVARMDALCTVLPRLLPEEIDPVEHTALGNAPLVWSHAELTRSLYVLDAVRRQRQ